MKQIKLKILNNNLVEILIGEVFIRPCLSYTATYWRKTRFKKEKINYQKSLIQNKKYFYTGYINRVKKYCKENNIQFNIIGELQKLTPTNKSYIPGITFRDYQLEFIEWAIDKQTTLLVAPPGSGKTLLALGIISCFKNSKTLFLIPNKDLMYQSHEVFSKYGHYSTLYGDGHKDILGDIVCGTIQSIKNIDFKKYCNGFDILFGDEIHLATKNKATIEKIISNLYCPVKIGLTATPPEDIEKSLIIEGLFSDNIKRISFERAEKEEIVTPIKVKIINVPTPKYLSKYKKYQDIYKYGIVRNQVRNNLILREVKNLLNGDKTCIVFCVKIEHIKILSELFNENGINHEVVYGDVSSEEREEIKEKLLKKEIKCCLASVVWSAGVDTKSLDAVLLAGSGKAPERLLQTIGRSMRTYEGKEYGIVIDFFDMTKYNKEHSEARLEVYKKFGWIDEKKK